MKSDEGTGTLRATEISFINLALQYRVECGLCSFQVPMAWVTVACVLLTNRIGLDGASQSLKQ